MSTSIGINSQRGGSSSGSGGGSGGGFSTVVEPTGTSADGTNIEAAAIAASADGGGIVQLTAGTYDLGNGIELNDLDNVWIRGVGDGTILTGTGDGSNPMIFVDGTLTAVNEPLDNFAIGATQVVVTTHANATAVLAGDAIFIYGNTVTSGLRDGFAAIAAANGDNSTGIVLLETPVPFAMTSPQLNVFQNNKNMKFSDFKMTPQDDWEHIIISRNSDRFHLDNITLDAADSSSMVTAAFYADGANNWVIENCRLYNVPGESGIGAAACADIKVLHNVLRGINLADVASKAPIRIGERVFGGLIQGNQIESSKGTGCIHLYEASGDQVSRMTVCENKINNGTIGIEVEGHSHTIENNEVLNCTSVGIRIISTGDRCSIIGNFIENCDAGIGVAASGNDILVEGNQVRKGTNYGIFINGAAPFCVVSGNRVDNMYAGVAMISSIDSQVSNNVCNGSDIDGIIIFAASDRINVVGNVCRDNNRDGIRLDGLDAVIVNDCLVNANTCIDNGGSGVDLIGTRGTIAQGNRCRGNAVGLTLIDGGTAVTEDCFIDGNHLLNNTANIATGSATGVNNTISDNKTT